MGTAIYFLVKMTGLVGIPALVVGLILFAIVYFSEKR